MSKTNDFISLLRNTTNSYKFLFLKSLVSRIRDDESHIEISDLTTDMLVLAWYPNQFFKLSLGSQDKIAEIFKNQGFKYEDDIPFTSPEFEKNLRKQLEKDLDATSISKLAAYVQYRLLHPFFDEDLRGKPDYQKNKMIFEMAANRYDSRQPVYNISIDRKSVRVHPEWSTYIKRNGQLLLQYIEFFWIEYLQKNNPNIPGIINKSCPPKNRNSLATQKRYWEQYALLNDDPKCIYSETKLRKGNISLDHFLPWTYVCHDRIWNIVPTIGPVNSSKGNRLPSIERYLDRFTAIQYQAMKVNSKSNFEWPKLESELLLDLGLSTTTELFDDCTFQTRLKTTIEGQYRLATQLGFAQNWVYN
ncbi:hypothetical protein NO989_13290 [Alteromonas sp. DY56-G5]|uniref:HNH endonuclease domain-containing protein n=1 Tax=Alteromonas sp. DY56-G5 TaxID=2967128 RepID=UPI00352ACC81